MKPAWKDDFANVGSQHTPFFFLIENMACQNYETHRRKVYVHPLPVSLAYINS